MLNFLQFILACRPHTYFGMKSRHKTSPVFGLMWMIQLTNRMPPPLRHWCNQGDGLEGYVWQMHDGVSFGVQEIREQLYTVKTEFVKQAGGSHGGDWSARISFVPKVRYLFQVSYCMLYYKYKCDC